MIVIGMDEVLADHPSFDILYKYPHDSYWYGIGHMLIIAHHSLLGKLTLISPPILL